MLSTDDRRHIFGPVASQTFRLELGGVALEGRFNDSATAAAIAAACPLDIRLSRWGDEYYGDCGVVAGADPDAREVMDIGDLAYWPPGGALCVFFGPTPASAGTEPRAASPVNPVGTLSGETDGLVAALSSLPGSVSARLTLVG
jgi:hypothetical protein